MNVYACPAQDFYRIGQTVTLQLSNGECTVQLTGQVTKLDKAHLWVNGIRFMYKDIIDFEL